MWPSREAGTVGRSFVCSVGRAWRMDRESGSSARAEGAARGKTESVSEAIPAEPVRAVYGTKV